MTSLAIAAAEAGDARHVALVAGAGYSMVVMPSPKSISGATLAPSDGYTTNAHQYHNTFKVPAKR
jgi:hypothetical protein